MYQLMKGRFGVQACHLLHINSSSSSSLDSATADQEALPNPWSRFVFRKQDFDVSLFKVTFYTTHYLSTIFNNIADHFLYIRI